MNFISLFSGIGGFDLGFERAGMTCAAQVEIDAAARGVLARRFPNAAIHEDVRHVGKTNLPAAALVCGGFPCQDVSVAGKRAGLAGERSGLWFEFHRILDELKPGWVVIENVPGLLSSNGGADFATILYGLADLGYGVCWRVLDAQYFGVAQRRRRVFIVGHLGDGRAAEVLFERDGGTRHPPARRAAGQGAAAHADGRALGGVAKTLTQNYGKQPDSSDSSTPGNFVIETMVAPPLTASGRGTERVGESRGQDCLIPTVAGTLSSSGAGTARTGNSRSEADMLIPTAHSFRMRGFGDYEADDSAGAVKARDHKDATDLIAWGIGSHASSADANVSNRSHANGGPAGMGISEELAHSLKSGRVGTVATYAVKTAHTTSNGWGVLDDGTTHTLGGSADVATTPYGVRRLTPTECERLMGLPDGWTAGQSDSARYKQLGNAVCVNVAEWIARRIVEVTR